MKLLKIFNRKDKKENQVSTLQLYTDLVVSKLTKGSSDRPDSLAEGYFYYSVDRIYTKGKIKKIFFINELPQNVDYGFLTLLRESVFRYGSLNIIIDNKPYELNLNSRRVRAKMNVWKERYEKALQKKQKKSELDTAFDTESNKELDNRNKHMIKSFLYTMQAKKDKRTFSQNLIIIELVCESERDLIQAENILKEELYQANIKYKGIFIQTNEYNKLYSPASSSDRGFLSNMNPSYVLTDEIIPRMIKPTQGVVGDEDGVYIGTDIYSNRCVTTDFSKGSDAKNFILSAKTGGGKSALVKTMINHFRVYDYKIILLDYEGDEYTDVGTIYGAVNISLGGKEGVYFDPVEIAELTGDEAIDSTLKIEAIKTTTLLFNLLTDENDGMNYTEKAIFNDAIIKAYGDRGVTEDLNTWHRSKGMTIHTIFDTIMSFTENEEYMERYGDRLLDFIDKLRTYLSPDGIDSHMFKRRISISQLYKEEFIIFSFGQKGSSQVTVDPKEMAIKQTFIGDLTSRLANYNKTKALRNTVVFIEEMQRYFLHYSSGEIINNIISGGRKRNMVNFLITNAPSQLIDSLQGDSDLDTHAKAIKENITGVILGKLTDEISEKLASLFNLEDSLGLMKMINETEDENNAYFQSFLYHFRGETTVLKADIPPSLLSMVETVKEHEAHKE